MPIHLMAIALRPPWSNQLIWFLSHFSANSVIVTKYSYIIRIFQRWILFSAHFNDVLFWMSLLFTFISCFIQSGAPWWRTTNHFPLLKNKIGFLKPYFLTSYVQTLKKQLHRYHTFIYRYLCCSAVPLQNTFKATSPFTDADMRPSPCLAA